MGHKIIVLEISDEQYNNLLAHIAQNGQLADASAVDLGDDTPAPVGAPSVDQRGVPWHATFHTANKTILKDGSFRRGKGVDKVAADAYEAPFIAAFNAANASAPVAAAPVMPGVVPVAAPAVGLPGLPVAAPVLQMPVAVPVPAPVSFDEVCKLFQDKLTSGKITNDQIINLYTEAGVDPQNVNELTTDETKRAKLAEILNRY